MASVTQDAIYTSSLAVVIGGGYRCCVQSRAKNGFVKILGEVRRRYGFALVGYVVMPEHIHLLIGEPTRGTPSTALQVLKQRVSRRLRGRPFRPISTGPKKKKKTPPSNRTDTHKTAHSQSRSTRHERKGWTRTFFEGWNAGGNQIAECECLYSKCSSPLNC